MTNRRFKTEKKVLRRIAHFGKAQIYILKRIMMLRGEKSLLYSKCGKSKGSLTLFMDFSNYLCDCRN